ncbi:MAG: tetratricopeptide repeat protein [Thermodesulfobacteriota bacterium]
MRPFFWLSVVLILIITGCATTETKNKIEAEQVRKLGEAYLAEKKYVAAYRELQKAMELDPTDAHVHYDMGNFYYEKKKFDTSIEYYQKALVLKPDFSSARNNLGAIYMELKEWDKAIETLEPLVDNYLYATPHFPHLMIGQAYFYKGDFRKALEHFQASRELKPDYPFSAHWMGKTYLEMRNPEKAVQSLEEAVKIKSNIPVFHYDLGRAYAAAGNYKKAEESFDRAASTTTEDQLKKDALEQLRQVRKKTCGR